jgi:hypothetical protein
LSWQDGVRPSRIWLLIWWQIAPGLVQAHDRLDGFSKDLEELSSAIATQATSLPQSVQHAIHVSLSEGHAAAAKAHEDIEARVARVERVIDGEDDGGARVATGELRVVQGRQKGMESGRKVALQHLVECAVEDLEGRVLESVRLRCSAADEAVRRCALDI